MYLAGGQSYYTLEESKSIRARIMELPAPGPEAEKEFHTFLEQLRKNADLYSVLLFGRRQVKLVSFNLILGTAAVKDEEGQVLSIDLSFNSSEKP